MAVLGCAAAGFVAALGAERRDLALIFVFIGVLSGVAVWPDTRRRTMSIRPDLACWLDAVSAVNAEPADDLVDRAVSLYRASLERTDDG
jgi:hypothetical protein